MTAPDNNDAALVRKQLLEAHDDIVPDDDRYLEAVKALDRLAAAAERADAEVEKWIDLEHKMMERATEAEEKLEDAEAALLVAQQERDALMAVVQSERPPEHVVKFFQRLHGLPEVGHLDWQARAERAEATITRLREALEIIATRTYPATYIGKREDGVEMYGGSDDASRFARSVLEKQ